MERRFDRLRKIYTLYDRLCDDLRLHCRKGCALCCTANVTLTSLEAELILCHWQARGQVPPIAALETAASGPRFQPSMTINRVAELCARDMDIPDEAADPHAGPCPLLQDELCSIYEARPFGCRAMLSIADCGQDGAADMPEWVLSANTLFLQYIEAADRSGITGNLTDVLLRLCATHGLRGPTDAALPQPAMPDNHPIPVIMIPPEHRRLLQQSARSLQEISKLPD